MAYLYLRDYTKIVQQKYLDQVLNNDDSIRTSMQPVVEQELRSYLVQRYDIDFEFRDLSVYSKSATYEYGERVYLDGNTYAPATAYVVDNIVLYQSKVYICIQAGTGQTPSTATAYWTLLGNQYDIYSVVLPTDTTVFDYDTKYSVGDEVWYKDKIYTALLNTDKLFPDDETQGAIYWGTGTAYSVTGFLPSNTTYFEAKDTRNPQFVMYMVDMVLFHLDTRLNPNQIPELRAMRYENAIAWLKSINTGKITLNLPVPTPESGNSIVWGSDPKLNLEY